jgi:hypothetical protein
MIVEATIVAGSPAPAGARPAMALGFGALEAELLVGVADE